MTQVSEFYVVCCQKVLHTLTLALTPMGLGSRMKGWCLLTILLREKYPGWAQRLTSEIPATREVEIRRIMVQGHVGQKVSKTPLQQTSWV
jgi:hypothetical protein